jgi:hypothetical protein
MASSNTFAAKVEHGVTVVREWQRGAIGWPEAVRMVDVTRKGEAVLRPITRTSNEDSVRAAVTAAVTAGN